jgi:hypothetical protein
MIRQVEASDVKHEGYSRRQQNLAGWAITVETYKLGEVYYCTVANVDPGPRFARAQGATGQEAEQRALAAARRDLERTPRLRAD